MEAAASAPWEMILNLVTDRYRSGSLLFVTRCLSRMCKPCSKAGTPDSKDESLRSVVIVSSAPGNLSREFSFETEVKLLRESFFERGIDHLENPNLDQIRKDLPDSSGTVTHFTGVDEIEEGKFSWPDSVAAINSRRDKKPRFYLANQG